MKKFLAVTVLLFVLATDSFSQETGTELQGDGRNRSIAISFFLTDFITPERIRSGSFSTVLREKQWAKLREMTPGITVSYIEGLKDYIDFAGSMSASFLNFPLPNKPRTSEQFLLLEADASAHLKMFPDRYFFTPYLNIGVGASKYQEYFGAFIPAGAGFRFNFFNEAALYISSQYRIPITNETQNYHFMNSIGFAGVIGKKRPQAPKPVPSL